MLSQGSLPLLPDEYGGAFTHADCTGALFLSTTPLLSDRMSLFLLLLFLINYRGPFARDDSEQRLCGGCFYMQSVPLKNGNKQLLLGVKPLTLQWRVIPDSASYH